MKPANANSLAEKYKYKLYNVCYDPTRDRTHDYLSRNLIDNSFEFNWGKDSGMILQFVLKLVFW